MLNTTVEPHEKGESPIPAPIDALPVALPQIPLSPESPFSPSFPKYCEFKRNGLAIDNSIPFDEWKDLGLFLQGFKKTSNFWIGDWLLKGEGLFDSDIFIEAVKATGFTISTLRNVKTVAKSIQPSLRNDKLSFSHHCLVASLSEDNQKKHLETAATKKLSVNQLRSLIKGTNGNGHRPVKAGKMVVCPGCGNAFEAV